MDENELEKSWKTKFTPMEYHRVRQDENKLKLLKELGGYRDLDPLATQEWANGSEVWRSNATEAEKPESSKEGSEEGAEEDLDCGVPFFATAVPSTADVKDISKGRSSPGKNLHTLPVKLQEYIGKKAGKEGIISFSSWFDTSMDKIVPSEVAKDFEKRLTKKSQEGIKLFRWDCDFKCNNKRDLESHLRKIHDIEYRKEKFKYGMVLTKVWL